MMVVGRIGVGRPIRAGFGVWREDPWSSPRGGVAQD